MGLVSGKCLNCGGDIQLDDLQEEGFCLHCGSKVKLKEAISMVRIDKSKNLNIYLEIAKSSLTGGNGKEVFEYANKALEIAPDSSEAWTLKMKSFEYIGTMRDPRITEVIFCGDNAIKFSSEESKEEKTKEIYTYYLVSAFNLMILATAFINDVESIKNAFQAMALKSFKAGKLIMQADAEFVNMTENLSQSVILLKIKVPEEKIQNDEMFQRIVKQIATEYINYSKGLTDRYAIYGSKLLDSAVDARRNILKVLKQGLQKEESDSIEENEINNTKRRKQLHRRK